MERAADIHEFRTEAPRESALNVQDLLDSFNDLKGILNNNSDSSAAAIARDFGELILVDESAQAQVGAAVDRTPPADNSVPTFVPGVIDDVPPPKPVPTPGRRSSNATPAEREHIPHEIARELPSSDVAPEVLGGGGAQDRFIDKDNQRRSVEVFRFENLDGESDEDGIVRAIAVDEDGLRTREVTRS